MNKSNRPPLLVMLLLLWCRLTAAQTSSTCNPLTQGSCPANPALGKAVNIDFTQGTSDSFVTSGGQPTYGSDGAQFTISRSGDSPTISSIWYLMFGRVEFVLKAAPGTGIVSSAILQSDDLDEIDWEWLGGDNTQVQSNYFGKGQTTTGYNRGAFHAASGNHDSFNTYAIDWTANQIVWSINGQTVRVLTPETAEANQYPQTPMMIKVGIWAGGDPANSWGTIQWAGGQTDYTSGPYSMFLKSIKATDYSTGTSYAYTGSAGTWESIKSNGGTVNPDGKGAASVPVSSSPVVSTATGAPMPLTTDAAASSAYATRTGWPWVAATATLVTTTSTRPQATTYSGLPSGWTVSDSGKVVPPSTGSAQSPCTSSWSACVSASSSASEVDEVTTTDVSGQTSVLTMTTVVAGQPKSYGSSTAAIVSSTATTTMTAMTTTLSSSDASDPTSTITTSLTTTTVVQTTTTTTPVSQMSSSPSSTLQSISRATTVAAVSTIPPAVANAADHTTNSVHRLVATAFAMILCICV